MSQTLVQTPVGAHVKLFFPPKPALSHPGCGNPVPHPLDNIYITVEDTILAYLMSASRRRCKVSDSSAISRGFG